MVKKDKKKIRKEKKRGLYEGIKQLLAKFNKVVFFACENIGSTQFHEIRKCFRKLNTEVLFGKKTMFKAAIKSAIEDKSYKGKQPLKLLMDSMNGSNALIFTNEDLSKIDEILKKFNRRKPARAHAIAPTDVILRKGPTGMDPKQTSIFQNMKIPTKINKQQLEIVEDVVLVKAGKKIGESEASLLEKLNIKPFLFQFEIKRVFENGISYGSEVLKLTDEVILKKVAAGIRNLSAASLTLGYPTTLTAPQMLLKGFKNLLSITKVTPYTFKEADMLNKAVVVAAKVEEKSVEKKEEVKKEEVVVEAADNATEGINNMFDEA
jgi:large subunit ribosomal protein LP0